MFGLNDALREREKEQGPIKVAVIGTGAMGGPMVHQIEQAIGMEAILVTDIDEERAVTTLRDAEIGPEDITLCDTAEEAFAARQSGQRVVSTNSSIAWTLDEVEVVVEATGNPFVYADIALNTIMNQKHLVTFNVEGDVVVGHYLKKLADAAGVVYTGVHGDEPGVVKALFDEADALGFEILAAGRNDYGGGELKWNQNNAHEYLEQLPGGSVQKNMALFASFLDGSKTNEECAMISNSTGLVPDVRGMHGPTVSFDDFVLEVPHLLDSKENGGILNSTGAVERILPAEGPYTQPVWCFVVVRIKNQLQRVYMADHAGTGLSGADSQKKLIGSGKTTAGLFYTPYHYVSIQAPISIAEAVVRGRPSIAPKLERRYADVMTLAKRDLRAGEIIDEIGGDCTAGRVERASVVKDGGYLPFALARGSRLVRDIPAGEYLRYQDVELQAGDSTLVQLRKLQDSLFEAA